MRRATLGWALEKRQWRMVEIQKTLQNLQADRISAIADTQAKILALAQEKIEQMRNSGNIQVKSLVKLWEMMRTESGLPKAYTHNTNDNNNIDLTQARQSLLDKVNKALPPKK